MTGPMRQPIDVSSLERYIDGHFPAIKTPLDVKQVREKFPVRYWDQHFSLLINQFYSLALVNPIQLIS